MKQTRSESDSKIGLIVSIAVHVTALGLLLVAFSDAEPLPEQHEAVPVEIVSSTDLEQVMQGQKEVKDIVADAPPLAETIAKTVDTTPDTQKPVAEKDVAAPPPPAPPEPVKDDTPPPPPPAPEPVQLPPQPLTPAPPPPPQPPERPIQAEAPPPADVPLPPVEPSPPPPAPLPPQRDVPDAETIAPTPPPKPQPPKPVKAAEPKPVPPPPPKPLPAPKPVEAKLPPPPPKPRPEKPKPDLLAKLLEQPPPDRPAHKATAHPKAADAQPDQHPFDPTDISKLLSAQAPSQKVSAGHQISKVKAAGSETGAAQKMAASLWDQLDGLLEDQYKQCWSYLGLDGPSKYVPQIKVLYAEDGGLMGEPVLINPPSDPAMRSLAESAVRAVRRCNPLKIPAQYAPYYDQWKGRVLRFDPVDMAG